MIKELENKDLIFKYDRCINYTFNSLRNNTLYFSSIKNFNDPFETMFSMQSLVHNKEGVDFFYENIFPFTALKNIKPKNREIIIKQRREHSASEMFLMIDIKNSLYSFIEDFFGVVCFSKTYNELLMWAHYANSGKGICQIFEHKTLFQVNSEGYPRIEAVNYENKLPDISINVKREQFNYDIRPIITTKRKNWSYENEVRAYINMSKITPFIDSSRTLINQKNGKLRNVKYNANALRGIIFGHQCTIRNINRIKKELELNPDIDFKNLSFYQATPDSWTGLYKYKKLK